MTAPHEGSTHRHEPPNYDRAFAIGVALNIGFVGVEAFYGFAVNSLSLVADAGHNLSDVLGLLLAWGASWLVRRASTRNRTYGFAKASILASSVNASILLIGVGAIAWEAVARFVDPQPVVETTVMWVAGLGIVINSATALMFMRGHKDDLNIQGAFLHMAADAGVSIGVVLAAWLMSRTGWLWLDPAISLAIAVAIAISTWGLFRTSLNLTLDAVPEGIDHREVKTQLLEILGVTTVHDLHIWAISTTSVALTAHLVYPTAPTDDGWLHELEATLHEKFGIDHATIQVERESAQCSLADVHKVTGEVS